MIFLEKKKNHIILRKIKLWKLFFFSQLRKKMFLNQLGDVIYYNEVEPN